RTGCTSKLAPIVARREPSRRCCYWCSALPYLPLSKNFRGVMLKLTDVTWLYQHLPMRCSLSVRQGEMIAVLGPSGAGKRPLLNLIAGFLQPASGSIVIENRDHTRTPPARRPVSMLFQENNLFMHLTVRQNIALGMDPGLKLNDGQRQKLELIAAQMGITAFID